MSDVAIKVENLTKIYPLYNSPKDRVKEALHPFRKKYHHDFYALKDVSFEIKKGENVGIIGRNGAGKSTLLKILTGVLTPTIGSVQVNGRVSSLLELGTGFNPELNGIENILFYGTVNGISQKEMKSKVDEIIEFADIGEFVCQPLKTYSSGMYVRLAFACATAFEPDILIIDEALSVGDIQFTQKCFRKIKEFTTKSVTFLFVSHDTGSVVNICPKTIWLNDGVIKLCGPSKNVVKHYSSWMIHGKTGIVKKTNNSSNNNNVKNNNGINLPSNLVWNLVDKYEFFGDGGAEIEKIAIFDNDKQEPLGLLRGNEYLSFFMYIKANEYISSPGFGIQIKDEKGNIISGLNNDIYLIKLPCIMAEETKIIKIDFKMIPLRVGKFPVSICIVDGTQVKHWIHDCSVLELQSTHLYQNVGYLSGPSPDSVKFSYL